MQLGSNFRTKSVGFLLWSWNSQYPTDRDSPKKMVIAKVRQEGAETTAKAPKEGHAPAAVAETQNRRAIVLTNLPIHWRFSGIPRKFQGNSKE